MAAEQNILANYLHNVGKLVNKYRKEKKYPLEELGFRIGLDRSSVRRIEIGEVNVTIRTLLKLAIALEKKPADFLQVPFSPQFDELSGLNKAERTSRPAKVKKEVIKKNITGKRKKGSNKK